jgi:hypothetical protein
VCSFSGYYWEGTHGRGILIGVLGIDKRKFGVDRRCFVWSDSQCRFIATNFFLWIMFLCLSGTGYMVYGIWYVIWPGLTAWGLTWGQGGCIMVNPDGLRSIHDQSMVPGLAERGRLIA